MADGNLGPEGLSALIAEVRPKLHRYCARMVGSAFEGEDVVQDALAKAAEALPTAGDIRQPENWLFRIAHNTALDALRRRARDAAVASAIDTALIADANEDAAARVAASAGLAAFVPLPPIQRSSVILADVLGYSLAETADILSATVPAVKAALHRARANLSAARLQDETRPALTAADRARLRAYADRFNARDFDALRDLLAEDVRLDLVNRTRLAGRKQVTVYFGRYEAAVRMRMTPVMAEGRLALLATGLADDGATSRYVVLLDWEDGAITHIRDFRYAPYVMASLEVRPI